ncbi:MAG: ORF6C domain-containing protein [Clostridia bacterium]|nr:ORF6C domain-containing protein [Clostridia bacterium]
MTTMNEEKALALLNSMTQQQTTNLEQMGMFLQQMGAVVMALDQRMKNYEKLTAQKLTVTSKQAKALQKRVQARSAALCEKYGFTYAEDGEAFRRAIWRDLKGQYGVDDVHDLPAAYFDLACQFVDGWQSFQTVRKVRARRGG